VQERLLEGLDRAGARATFFLQGRWVEAYPDTARQIAAAGHLVGNHSHYHVRMPLLSDIGFETDVRAAEDAILDETGIDPQPWFRLPFGAGAEAPALHGWLEAIGYRHIGWDVEPEEWRTDATDPEIEDWIVDGAVERGDGAIVLLHTWPRPTLVVERAIERLRDAGAVFSTVDEVVAARATEEGS
jgi:peptidoglycan-N-acetylglucosamine deacetylase